MEQPEVFVEPQEPDIFQQPNTMGTGFKTIDNFISDRMALMSDEDDVLRNLAVAQQNVTMLDHDQLQSYVNGLSSKVFDNITVDVINHYADQGDVDTGVIRAGEIQDAAGEETEVRRLANASAQYLDKFSKYSIPREIARRQYAALLISKKLEEVGITPDKWYDVAIGMAATVIPGRRTLQELGTDFSVSDTVKNLHRLQDEDFLKALPDVMDEVMKMSGENPFMFMERMEAYLNPEDVDMLKVMLAQDVTDVALTFAGITSLLKLGKFANARNTPIKIVRDSGQKAKAAELNAAALSDSGAAANARTTQADAAQSTSPFGGEGVDPNVTDTIAAETQAIIAARGDCQG
jgi:hypothetical protein